jgi:serine/threonine-protein kinase
MTFGTSADVSSAAAPEVTSAAGVSVAVAGAVSTDASDAPDALEPTPSAPATATETPAAEVTSGAAAEETSAEVPNVIGNTLAEARRILAEAGFHNVTVQGERRTGSEYDHCETTAQSPGGGSQAEHGVPIIVSYVYVGSDDC